MLMKCRRQGGKQLTLSLPQATIVALTTLPLATIVDETRSVPQATVVAVFFNVCGWSLTS